MITYSLWQFCLNQWSSLAYRPLPACLFSIPTSFIPFHALSFLHYTILVPSPFLLVLVSLVLLLFSLSLSLSVSSSLTNGQSFHCFSRLKLFWLKSKTCIQSILLIASFNHKVTSTWAPPFSMIFIHRRTQASPTFRSISSRISLHAERIRSSSCARSRRLVEYTLLLT